MWDAVTIIPVADEPSERDPQLPEDVRRDLRADTAMMSRDGRTMYVTQSAYEAIKDQVPGGRISISVGVTFNERGEIQCGPSPVSQLSSPSPSPPASPAPK